tara:strand:- start:364 stop:516 length:153 start_codon:yes stop_codon:yes gene_type:complete
VKDREAMLLVLQSVIMQLEVLYKEILDEHKKEKGELTWAEEWASRKAGAE